MCLSLKNRRKDACYFNYVFGQIQILANRPINYLRNEETLYLMKTCFELDKRNVYGIDEMLRLLQELPNFNLFRQD